MKRKIKASVVNPAGNITIFVKEPFPREEYINIANQLLDMKELSGEQVCFVLDCPKYDAAAGKNTGHSATDEVLPEGKMEMCGLEFCGNASRSFGLMLAKEKGIEGTANIPVKVSGCDEILTVEVCTDTDYTKVKMPSYERIFVEDLRPIIDEKIANGEDLSKVYVVDFGGIIHVVLKDIRPSRQTFDLIKAYINEKYNPPAMGVMFCNRKERNMVPVVYVKDVDTTYFEGSCGSGTTACAIAFSIGKEDGTYTYTIPQPHGTIGATAVMEKGQIVEVYIEGIVEIGPDIEIEVEISN